MSSANISDRLYTLSENIGGGTTAEAVESIARQASALELDIKNFADEVEVFNSMETWNSDTLADFMQRTNLYVHKFSRSVPSIYGTLEENT